MDEFVSKEEHHYKFRIGTVVASSLAGFIAGILFGAGALALIWWAATQAASAPR